MTKYSNEYIESLPIYDDESKKLVPVQHEIVNIHEVAARARYRLIDGPIKCAKAHICKYARKSYDHLTRLEKTL